ncbi:MAG TPA: hypothetical protein VFB77_18420 [Acidimicrobiales bacterium]|nr:hypothetical protein [Acidimicrobiales bacterium]
MTDGVPHDLIPGARVEVRNRFDGSWSTGFEVAEAVGAAGEDDDAGRGPTAYRVRRVADAAVLNGTFRPDDLRREPPRRRW